jgi:hypothetical protein
MRTEERHATPEYEEETSLLLPLLKKDPKNQPLRRIFARSTFAMIEASCAFLRGVIVSEFDKNPGVFTFLEEVALREQMPRLEDGSIQEVKARFRTVELILFTLNMVARFAEENAIDHKSKEWSNFKSALNLRNRLTHPHIASDWIVSDGEYRSLLDAAVWYRQTVGHLLEEILKYGHVYE